MDRARPMKNVKNAQSINNSPIRYPILTQKENRNNPFLMFNESNLPNYTNPVHQSIQAHDKLDDIANDNGTASSASTSFNIIKGIMGVALLTLPWSIANVGLLPSVIFLFLSFILSYISWIFLCLLCEHYSVYSYRDIGLVVFGPWFATVLDLVLLVFLYLISILYVMFLSQFIIAGLAAFNIPVDTTNFVHVATYLLFIGFVGSLLLLEFWRQKALALYVSTYVLAVYRVFVTTAGVLFGAFYWNDFVGTKGVYIGIYVLAILVSFVGVAVITLTENTKMFGGEKKSETNVEQAQNVCDNEDNQL
eukprot:240444_1